MVDECPLLLNAEKRFGGDYFFVLLEMVFQEMHKQMCKISQNGRKTIQIFKKIQHLANMVEEIQVERSRKTNQKWVSIVKKSRN